MELSEPSMASSAHASLQGECFILSYEDTLSCLRLRILTVEWTGHAHRIVRQLIVSPREQTRPAFAAAGDPPGGNFALLTVGAGIIAVRISEFHWAQPLLFG